MAKRFCQRFGRSASGRRVCRSWSGGGRKRKRGRRRSAMHGFGSFAGGEVSGHVNHCVKYKRLPSGKRRCMRFGRPGGRPRGRKAAGITTPFYERSKKRKLRARTGPGRSKVCIRRKRAKNGRMVCAAYAPRNKRTFRTKGRKRSTGRRGGRRSMKTRG